MTTPELVVVGRVRKPHGIRGELVVEPITDAPAAIFAAGRRVFVGTHDGRPLAEAARPADAGVPRELTVRTATPFKEGLIVRFDQIADRTAAESWRERYLLVPAEELAPPGEDEVYYHDLIGMRVRLVSGEPVGEVTALYELPQGLVLDIRLPRGTVMVQYRPEVVRTVDLDAREVVIDPPEGLLPEGLLPEDPRSGDEPT